VHRYSQKNRKPARRRTALAVSVVVAAIGIFVVINRPRPAPPTTTSKVPLTQRIESQRQLVSPDGFTGLALTDEEMHFRVAVRNPDGSIGVQDAPGRLAAERLVRASQNGNLTGGKEHGVER